MVAQSSQNIDITDKLEINLTPKMRMWLYAYLNEANPRTFMNLTRSSEAAGYKCQGENEFAQIGVQNFRKLKPILAQWLDTHGFSDNKLKFKAVSLLEAHETKFEKIKGTVNPETLPPHVSVLTTTDITTSDPDTGETRTLSGETLLGIEVNALETQRKTLDMAFRVKGMYAPEKHAVLAKGDLTVHVETGSEVRALLEAVASAVFGRKEDGTP